MAKSQKAELKAMVASEYSGLIALFGRIAEELGHQAQETYKEGKEQLIDLASGVDTMVRKDPWPYIGAAVLGSFVFSILQGKSKK